MLSQYKVNTFIEHVSVCIYIHIYIFFYRHAEQELGVNLNTQYSL